MSRHEHADLIHAWAEGAEVEIQGNDSRWEPCPLPLWTESKAYRIKPIDSEWWENIPEHGLLCWVNDLDGGFQKTAIACVIEFEHSFVTIDGITWKYASPLTNEEIERFKR